MTTKTTIRFETLTFFDKGEDIKIVLLKNYHFVIPKAELSEIGKFIIKKNSITFDTKKRKAETSFNRILAEYMKNLRHTLNHKPAVYIHKFSGVPLIGNTAFGIVDRNSSLIEIKPSTGCNLNCVYCSVDEGKDSKRNVDYIVEREYLVEELTKVIEKKECSSIEVHINMHGEPMLYPEIAELIRDCSNIPQVKDVTMTTNGTMLTEKKADALIKAGMTRINISLNGFTKESTARIANAPYNLECVKQICKYLVEKHANRCKLNIAPTWIPGYNDDDIKKIVEWGVSIKKSGSPTFGIQKFLTYKSGRNPVKEPLWEDFFEMLKALEKRYDVKLIVGPEDFNIIKTNKLEKPFKKGDVIKTKVVFRGRMNKEMIGIAEDRNISIKGCDAMPGSTIKVKVVRSKHNIFYGTQR